MYGFEETRFPLTIFSNKRINPMPQFDEAVLDITKFTKLNCFKLQEIYCPFRINNYEALDAHRHDDVSVTFIIFCLNDARFGFVFEADFNFLRRHHF